MVSKVRADTVGASVRNVGWAYASFFCTKGLNLASVVILAWYLDPAEFGVMAICLAVMSYLEIISQFGMGAALISAQEKIEETASAVFMVGLTFSLLLLSLLWITAEPVAAWYGDAQLAELLPVIGFALVVHALTTVNTSFLYRELKLKQKLLPDTAKGLCKGGAAIVLALLGFGVWSLVLGHLAGAVAATLVTWWVRPWWPSKWPDFATFRYILGFGGHLIGAQTINATPRLLDNLLVGKILGMQALGIYSLAFRIPELGIKSFTNVVGSVLHPMMSRLQSDRAELVAYYYGALKYSALLMFGAGAGIAVMAEPMVHLLYPPKWYPMIEIMQLIAVAFAIGTINMVPGNLFKALNRTDLMFKVSLINLPFFLILLWLAVPHGIVAVAMVQLTLAVIRFVPNYLLLRRAIDITARNTFAALLPGAVSALSGATAGFVLLHSSLGGDNDLSRLLLTALAFTLAYLIVASFTAPETTQALLKHLRRKWSKPAKGPKGASKSPSPLRAKEARN